MVSSPATSTLSLTRDRDAEQRRRLAGGDAGDRPRRPRRGPARRSTTRKAFSRAVEAVDPLQVERDEIARGDLAVAEQLGLAGDSCKGELRIRPSPRSYWRGRTGFSGRATPRPVAATGAAAADQRGDRDERPPQRDRPPERLEAHHPPAPLPRHAGELGIRVDGDRVADELEHRQVGGRVGIGEALRRGRCRGRRRSGASARS